MKVNPPPAASQRDDTTYKIRACLFSSHLNNSCGLARTLDSAPAPLFHQPPHTVNMEQLLLPMPVQASEHESMESAQAQSVALVQIFLNASLACICYARELLDWRSPCFKKRRIGDISLECSPDEIYNAFVSLDCVEEETSQEIRVLVRSQNHRANRILDMIVSIVKCCRRIELTGHQEYGIFDAIEQGYVDTLQVFITNDAQHNKSILEAYTYCFRYQGARVTGVDLRASDDTFTLEDCQKSFKLAFRGLLRSVQSLPPLPGTA